MNCKNLIVCGFNLEATLFNRYLDEISQAFHSKNPDNLHGLQVVNHNEEFASAVLSDSKNVGICVGGSGVQECAYLNGIKGIRAALTHTKYIAEMSRKHNDANVMIISSDCIGEKLAASLALDFLLSGFDNEERNMLRIEKMKVLEEKYSEK